jgi:hypothetical protein
MTPWIIAGILYLLGAKAAADDPTEKPGMNRTGYVLCFLLWWLYYAVEWIVLLFRTFSESLDSDR